MRNWLAVAFVPVGTIPVSWVLRPRRRRAGRTCQGSTVWNRSKGARPTTPRSPSLRMRCPAKRFRRWCSGSSTIRENFALAKQYRVSSAPTMNLRGELALPGEAGRGPLLGLEQQLSVLLFAQIRDGSHRDQHLVELGIDQGLGRGERPQRTRAVGEDETAIATPDDSRGRSPCIRAAGRHPARPHQ
jgi:hypothetical protein